MDLGVGAVRSEGTAEVALGHTPSQLARGVSILGHHLSSHQTPRFKLESSHFTVAGGVLSRSHILAQSCIFSMAGDMI